MIPTHPRAGRPRRNQPTNENQTKEADMYTCSMCKKATDGDVAFKNAAGSFCKECKAIIHSRAAEASKARSHAPNGCCRWCGEKITTATMQTGKDDEHVCQPCTTRRDWLLNAIRHSDRPARYVARTEERERPMREERAKAMQAANMPLFEGTAHNDAETRLRRLELMIGKLTNALGV